MALPEQFRYRGISKFDDEDANFAEGNYLSSFISNPIQHNKMISKKAKQKSKAELEQYEGYSHIDPNEMKYYTLQRKPVQLRGSGLLGAGITPETVEEFERLKISNQYKLGQDKNIRDYSATVDRNVRSQEEQRYKTLTDYQTDIYGANLKSKDTRYATNVDADTKRGLGIANIQSDERTSKYKTDVGAGVEKFKHTTVDETKRYQQSTVNQTELAKAKVSASPEDYMSQDTLSRKVNDQRRAQNNANDQRYFENQLKIAEFNAKQADKPSQLQQGVDKANARSAIESDQRMNRAMEAAKLNAAYAKEARDRFYEQGRYQDAKTRYEQDRQDKFSQNMQARQDYAAASQDAAGQRAYAQHERQGDKAESKRRYDESRKDRLNADSASRSLQQQQFEFTKTKFEQDLARRSEEFDKEFGFKVAQYSDKRSDMKNASSLAASARASIGSPYGTTALPTSNLAGSFSGSNAFSSALSSSFSTNVTTPRRLVMGSF